MAHFLAEAEGSRNPVHRLGGKGGVRASARGWNIGGNVNAFVDDEGRDCIRFSLTGGSNGSMSSQCVGTYYRDGQTFVKKDD